MGQHAGPGRRRQTSAGKQDERDPQIGAAGLLGWGIFATAVGGATMLATGFARIYILQVSIVSFLVALTVAVIKWLRPPPRPRGRRR